MRLPLRRSADTSQPSPESEPSSPTPQPPPSAPEQTPEPPHPEPAPPAADVRMDALGMWDEAGSLRTATFAVTRLAVGHARVEDPGNLLGPGTKVVLRLELPDGPYAMLGQAGAAAAETVTVSSVGRGDDRLRRFLTDQAR